ncbi:MAG: hypothetical protein NUW21_09220 [Elusimicrobia bacterium]|nr:hypothetical protein [Elusimicrobiota bacterium]
MALASLIALLLLPAPCAAGQARVVVERVETAPQVQAGAGAFAVPLLSPAQVLAPSLTPALTPLTASPAAIAPIPVLPAPAAGLAPAPAALAPLKAAASVPGSPTRGPPSAAVPSEADAGAAMFDGASAAQALADVARSASGRPLAAGVFIQQEQEGSLIAQDSRDSSGTFFKYYRPAELRPALVAEVRAGLKGFAKAGYGLRRALSPFSKGDGAVWEALSKDGKLAYLDKYEKAVIAERGAGAAWKGKTFLLMERAPGAPDFLAEHPDMEAPPAGYEHIPGHRFLQPEIVSGKLTPASSVGEALGRTKRIIGDTGHAGTQYHVFVKAEPEVLRAQLAGLQAALQAFNDALYAQAAQDSFQNVVHASLQPWHAGRSRRVAELLSAAEPEAHVPPAEDPDSEKHAFVGLRYWGTENGKLVVSLELRGASLPFKGRKSAARDMEIAELPKRNYDEAQRWLSLLAAYAESLARGAAPRTGARPLILDGKAADALLSARAAKRGMPKDSYFGAAALAKRFTGAERVAPGLLLPFAASAPGSAALDRFLDEWLDVSAKARSLEAAGGEFADARRYLEYQLWNAYAAWGRSHEPVARARLAAILAGR